MPPTPPRKSPGFSVPEAEIDVRASRSGGPGGQHVNTASTRVEVRWQPASSSALTDGERARVVAKLASRLDTHGWIRVVASDSRSQLQNRRAAVARLNQLVTRALTSPKPRRRTAVPKAERARRLEEKRKRSTRKRERRPVRPDD